MVIKKINEFHENLIKNKLSCDNMQPKTRKTRVNYTCKICNYIFEGFAEKMFCSSPGCVKCSGLLKLTNDDIDKYLINTKMKRVGDYKGNKALLPLECLECGYQWSACFANIKGRSQECPECVKKTWGVKCIKPEKEVKDYLLAKNLELIGDYTKVSDIHNFKCLKCFNTFDGDLGYIIRYPSAGCSQCRPRQRGTNENIVKSWLIENQINFTHNYGIKKIDELEPKFYVDFYLKDYNIIIEYNGAQHYRPVKFSGDQEKAEKAFKKQTQRDLYIRYFCEKYNITLIEINGLYLTDDKLKEQLDIYYKFIKLIPITNSMPMKNFIRPQYELGYCKDFESCIMVENIDHHYDEG